MPVLAVWVNEPHVSLSSHYTSSSSSFYFLLPSSPFLRYDEYVEEEWTDTVDIARQMTLFTASPACFIAVSRFTSALRDEIKFPLMDVLLRTWCFVIDGATE